MQCPNCNETLVMSERQGIEIDYCPKCRGVWLDRGELDKLIERSTASSAEEYPKQERYPEKKQDSYYRDSNKHYHYKKKKGFLGDLFDFD